MARSCDKRPFDFALKSCLEARDMQAKTNYESRPEVEDFLQTMPLHM
jgi:hypothetical protein